MRFFPRTLRFWTAFVMLTYWCALTAAPAAAGLAPSRASGTTTIASQREADVLVVQRALEHKVVAQKLRDYGVSPAEVEARLANLSDADLHQVATAAKGLPSGGDGLGTLVAILVIVILVIVIVKLMNKEIVVR
jgi:hypothetical protein